MAVLMNKQLGFIVEGGYRATADVKPGQFVTLKHDTKEANIATSIDGAMIVLQRNDAIDEEAVADSDVVYKKGEFIPLRKLQKGDVFTTDQFSDDITSIKIGDKFTVGSNGLVVKDENGAFVVVDIVTLFGNQALKLLVE